MKRLLMVCLSTLTTVATMQSFAVCYRNACCFPNRELMTVPVDYCLPCGLRDGIYVGGGVGYDAYKFRQGASFSNGIEFFNANPALTAKGFMGQIFGGYGRYFNRFYIAGEIAAADTTANTNYAITSPTTLYSMNLDIRVSYAASIIAGFKVNPFALVYGRIGYIKTTFKSTETTDNPTITGLNASTTKYGNGLNYGVGIETAIYKAFSLRSEYTYTSYTGFTTPLGTTVIPSNNEFVISAIYHFDYPFCYPF